MRARFFRIFSWSFTGTEVEYALEVCDAVADAWEASKENKIIINLPSTVQMDTPNVFADQIEYIVVKILKISRKGNSKCASA